MKQKLPGLQCDDDGSDDKTTADDDGKANDDKANDDSTPDDYWRCLKEAKGEKDCSTAGCTWCVSV